jgi:AsmA family
MTDSTTSSPATGTNHKLRNRLIGVALALLFLLALILTPPLLNVNRYRHRIADSMSQSLGRPVHLDSVTLHLLPTPGFTLQNLVVSENPGFGSEPTIRANVVEVSLRPSSLWRRQVEFSTVRFVEPSLNLVRNPAGRWNLEDLLVHAARVNTAPTVQAKPSAQPRFPYIEATGGRVNIKLGDEKMPFSLTDADLAVWLPSPQQWQVRLVARPARTDTDVADPGIMRIEGSLGRADRMADVPVHLEASWHDAPLGNASRLLTGDDAGWRGTLQTDATLNGTLGSGHLAVLTHLVDLRRADFVPVNTLNIDATCNATAQAAAGTLQSMTCTVPTPGPQPLTLQAETVDLQRPLQTGGTVQATDIPLTYLFDWLRLLSARTPAAAQPSGTVDVDIARTPTADWSGNVTVNLPPTTPRASGSVAHAAASTPAPLALHWNVISNGATGLHLQLPITTFPLAPAASVAISSDLSADGYTLRANGTATPAQLTSATRDLPQLTDGLTNALPTQKSTTKSPARLDVTCTRRWGTDQTCTPSTPPQPTHKPRRHHSS